MNDRHRTVSRLKKRYKHLAAAVAGAAILAGTGLPGLPATVHASASPEGGAPPSVSQQVTKSSPENYKKVLNITATAYAPGAHDNAQWGNKTYLGTQVRPGIIAVDPKVIPLGSRVYIEFPDGHGFYAVAEDTGGAIKGNRIDVAVWSVKEAYNFGMQKVKVYVVSSPAKSAKA